MGLNCYFCVAEKDDSFREFRRICALVAEVPAYTDKSSILRKFFLKGSSGGTIIFSTFYNLMLVN